LPGIAECTRSGPGQDQGGNAVEILETIHDILAGIAQSTEEEAGYRSGEELINLSEDVQYNRSCKQKMAKMLTNSQDPQI
jgi:hypothetical protein